MEETGNLILTKENNEIQLIKSSRVLASGKENSWTTWTVQWQTEYRTSVAILIPNSEKHKAFEHDTN